MCIEGNFIILCPRLTLQTFAKIQIDWQDLLRETMVLGGWVEGNKLMKAK